MIFFIVSDYFIKLLLFLNRISQIYTKSISESLKEVFILFFYKQEFFNISKNIDLD